MFAKPTSMVFTEQPLPGRAQTMTLSTIERFVNKHDIKSQWPTGYEHSMFGLGGTGVQYLK